MTQDHTRKFPVLNSIPVLVAAYKGLNCFWPMPFRKHCRITVTNIGKVNWPLYWMITGIRKPLPDNTVYFHASYRSARPVPEQQVYTIIDGIRGQGHYVGTSLGIEVNDGACWCEGEVKMFIDGETNASLNYTGTEDYFCGSFNFGADQLRQYHDFSGPFCGMYNISYRMCRLYAPNRFMAYRWHIPDPVYFKKSFRVTVQDFGTDYSTEPDIALAAPCPAARLRRHQAQRHPVRQSRRESCRHSHATLGNWRFWKFWKFWKLGIICFLASYSHQDADCPPLFENHLRRRRKIK